MVDLVKVKHSGRIDLSEWGFSPGVQEDFESALEETLKNNPVGADFPFSWSDGGSDGSGGPAVSDPGTIYVFLPLCQGYSEYVLKTSLCDLVSDFVDGLVSPLSNKIENPNDQKITRTLASHLRELAEKLDSACEGT